ncbi:MAG: 1-deoxy-D-xylulose-5-phosphate reductoisomerase [Muribaculaceae bacterium]|nr:1-deoxy-D-xylulose-5-phosphate reductoisomerase [Muribaculaceae bacterium]
MNQSPQRIAILGSTGSIGTQALDVVSRYPERFNVTLLVAGSRVDTLIQQAIRFRPSMAVIADESKLWKLRDALAPLGIETTAGATAVADAVTRPDIDTLLTATVGYSGLAPTLRAIAANKDIALANKETLVVAGAIVKEALAASSSKIIPVDSEHSAIYQSLVGEDPASVERLIITASGGPFRKASKAEIDNATAEQALRHPNWSMGAKITVDSATMVNKAFEIIEARWLFDVPFEKITPLVHPQSIVHSMVEFTDGAIKAQLGTPDMRLPIQYALGHATRMPQAASSLTLGLLANLTFERPDTDRFPGLLLAETALTRGGNAACIINAANEIAVASFLRGDIRMGRIVDIINETLARASFVDNPSYEQLVATNTEARAIAQSLISNC